MQHASERRLPETSRVERLLEIIWLISAAPRDWTRKRLARRFEVSERMITSDLEVMRHGLKFDVRADRGQGYYIESAPQLPSVSYSLPEALALLLAAEAGRQLGGISQQDLSSAIARLSSVFPPELRRMVERYSSDGPAGERSQRERMLAVCGHATLANRRLEIVYSAASRGGEETRRQVDPYALFPYLHAWHLVGYCHLREAVRDFKIDRIREAVELPASFVKPSDFDVAAFLAGGWGLMRGLDTPLEEVVLRFSPTAAPWVSDETWHPSQQLHRDLDGSLRFRVVIQMTPEFQRWVLHFGREVDILQPASLRDWLREEVLATLTRLDAIFV